MTEDSRAAELAQAEAEAAAAEAAAVAAQARARALRLRQDSGAAEADPADAAQAPAAAGQGDNDDADDADDTATDQSENRPRERPRWAAVGAGVALVAIVTSTALSGYFMVHHRNASDRQHRAAEYAAAAQQGIVTLMSLDYNSAKEDVQRVIDNSTGDFKDNFQDTADDFIKVVEQAKVGTETTVKATAVQSMSNDSAVVLVAATSKITNAAGAKQDPRPWRLSVTVTRDGDQLKMSKVEFVV